MNIVADKFNELLEKGLQEGKDFKTIIGMYHLERFYWFDKMRKASLVKGYIAERLSYFTDSIGKIL
jgi:hypothetical protein